MSKPFAVPSAVAAPGAGYMSLTVVGSGASTAVPLVGHIHTDCACRDAVANPDGCNRRANTSLLITTPRAKAADNDDGGRSDRVRAEENESSAEAEKRLSHTDFFVAEGNEIDGVPVSFTLVDCGKTIREAYFRVLVRHRVRLVDTLLLTCGRAEAISGLDDLRDLQQMHMIRQKDWQIDSFIHTYLSEGTLKALQERVGYIIRNSQLVGEAAPTRERHDTLLREHIAATKKAKGEDEWNVIGIRRSTALLLFTLPESDGTAFSVPTLCGCAHGQQEGQLGERGPALVYAVPAEHGDHSTSLGFVFGRGTAFKGPREPPEPLPMGSCVVYLPAASALPEGSLAFLRSLRKITVLFLSCTYGAGQSPPSSAHGIMDGAVGLVAALKPQYAFLVGMSCQLTHEEGSAYLRGKLAALVQSGVLADGEVLGIELAYDGLEIVLPQ